MKLGIKRRIANSWKKMSLPEKIFLVVAIVLTVLRFMIAMKIPLHIQAGAVYDDRMMVNYSTSLLSGRWLGGFNQFSLAKGASYSIFLVLNYLLGLPYSFTLILLYAIAIILFCVALFRLIKSKTFLYILYTALLYSPVMFHDENVQKVYRGGVIVIFALMIVAAIIGLYTRIEERNKKVIKWSLTASFALAFFWFLKEDSIWIMPFVVGGIGITVIHILRMKGVRREKIKKVALACMPLVCLGLAVLGYKTINLISYGEFAVTDRQGTYFKDVMTDLIKIEGEGRSKDNWVTKDMLKKAYEVSPTFAQVKKEIEKGYEGWAKEDGEIEGDIVFWAIKDAVAEAGFYENGTMVNEYYENVHNELAKAFEDGRLKRNNDFYISSSAKGINENEISDFLELMGRSMDNVVSYEYNETGIYPATGDANGIALFGMLTMSQYVSAEAEGNFYKIEKITTDLVNGIVKIYQITGKVLFCLMVITFVVFSGYIFYLLIKKRNMKGVASLYLVVVGMFGTCFTLFFGTTFFCRFLSQRKVYDYASPMLPLLLVVELISIYLFVTAGRKLLIARSNKRNK